MCGGWKGGKTAKKCRKVGAEAQDPLITAGHGLLCKRVLLSPRAVVESHSMQTLEAPISVYLNAFISVIFGVHGTSCVNFMNSGYTKSLDYLPLGLNTKIAGKEL